MQFAKKYLNWKKENWGLILWSDESKINLINSDGRSYVRRPKNTAFPPKYTKKTVKHGGGNILVWGCFSSIGVGPLFLIDGKMTADYYINILETTMLPYAEDHLPLKWRFQQDIDPKHTAKKSLLGLKKISSEIGLAPTIPRS